MRGFPAQILRVKNLAIHLHLGDIRALDNLEVVEINGTSMFCECRVLGLSFVASLINGVQCGVCLD